MTTTIETSAVTSEVTTADMMTAATERLDGRVCAHTAVNDRAKRASAAIRLAAIAAFAMAEWKDRLKAIFGMTFGRLGHKMVELIDQCYAGSTEESAIFAHRGFRLAEPELSFLDREVLEAMEGFLGNGPNRGNPNILRGLAAYAGLGAEAGIYETRLNAFDEQESVEVGRKFDLDAVLARGVAEFEPSALPELLRYWAGLANRSEVVAVPATLDRQALTAWGKAVLQAARDDEGSNAPSSSVRPSTKDKEVLVLDWWGTFTSGRNFRLLVRFGADQQAISVEADWDSATGKPSRFLGVELLLALPGCKSFDVQVAGE